MLLKDSVACYMPPNRLQQTYYDTIFRTLWADAGCSPTKRSANVTYLNIWIKLEQFVCRVEPAGACTNDGRCVCIPLRKFRFVQPK